MPDVNNQLGSATSTAVTNFANATVNSVESCEVPLQILSKVVQKDIKSKDSIEKVTLPSHQSIFNV